MGIFANTGVSVTVEDTFPKGRGFLGTLTDSILSWSHTSASTGGYLTANASVGVTPDVIDEWLERGLGRWLTLYDEGANICWRGFVDQITASIAGLQIVRGPLTQIANRAGMVYCNALNPTDPPVLGSRKKTTLSNDADSQVLYGIWEKALSVGAATDPESTQLRDLYIRENAQPQTTKTLVLGGKNLGMTLELKGAWSWLSYIINIIGVIGTVNLSTRITNILGLDPNAIFSTDYTYITANIYQVEAFSNDDKVASKYIQELLNFGDAAFNRYTAGFYGSEVFYYTAAPTQIEYVYSLSEPEQQIRYQSGVVVRPWAVLPARWLQISDLMIGRVNDTDLRDDPRNLFIEQVTYTAPYGLTINGAKVGTLLQVLAQKGLGGLG